MKQQASRPYIEILIVEDSPTQAEQLKYSLVQQEYLVRVAKNGQDALTMVHEHQPHVIITDIVMPEMDGYELCKRIRSDKTISSIPIIFLTSLSDFFDVIRGLECGADHFLVKPCHEDYLLSKIDYILAHRHLQNEDFTQLALDITLRGHKYSITSTRMQILNLLLSSFESAVQKNRELREAQDRLQDLNVSLERIVQERTAALELEIAERVAAEVQLHHRLELEGAIAHISRLLVDAVDPDIQQILTILGEFLNVHRIRLFQFVNQRDTFDTTHEWCAPGMPSFKNDLQNLASTEFPWLIERLNQGDIVVLGTAQEFTPTLRVETDKLKIDPRHSTLQIPYFSTGRILQGFFQFEDAKHNRDWNEYDVRSLKIVTEIFANSKEHREAQRAILEMENLYRDAIQVADAVPYYQNYATDTYDFVGEGIKALTGFSAEEFTRAIFDENTLEVIHLGNIKELSHEEAVEKVRNDPKREWKADYRFRTKDGQERWLSNAAIQVRDERGNAIGSLGILQDITERKRTETALKESESRLNAVVEKTTTMLVVVDRNGVIQFSNTAFQKHIEQQVVDGVARHDNFILSCIQSANVPEGCGRGSLCETCLMRHLIKQTFVTKEHYDRVEVILPKPESNRGRDTIFLVSTTPLENEQEDSILISIEDISNIKNVERALEQLMTIEEALANVSRMFSIQKEPDFDEVLKTLGKAVGSDRVVIFRFDEDKKCMTCDYVWCAPGVTWPLEKSRTLSFDAIPWWMERIMHEDTVMIEDVDTLSQEASGEKQILSWLEIRSLLAAPIVSHTGRKMGFLGYDIIKRTHQWSPEDIQIIRVTAEMISNYWSREEAIASLQESENRRRFAMQAARMGTWEWDITSNDVTWDENTFFIFGRQPKDFDGKFKSFVQMIHPEDRKFVERNIDRFNPVEPVVEAEFRVLWPDNSVHHLRSKGQIIANAAGVPVRMVGLCWDITNEKSLEEQLRQAQKMDAIGQLAGGIAHDFNNLLMVINGYSECLLNELNVSDKRHEELEEIVNAGRRAASLTRQLLAFSRKQIVQPEILNLNVVLSHLEKMLQRLIGEHIALVLRAGSDLSYVRIDPGQIEQVIMNICINARDAMPNGGQILIETQNVELSDDYSLNHFSVTPGYYVMIVISDTGTGMSKETLERIFEPFFTTKEVGKGTGLGLSTVYGIVKQNLGHIWVYSELRQGTTFKIYLPVCEPVHLREKTLQTKDDIQGSECILVVEDEESVRKLMERFLVNAGYTVLVAENGEEALARFGNSKPSIQLLITDMIMPKMGGTELAAKMKEYIPDLRVLYVSGYTESTLVRKGDITVGENLLQKPVDSTTLLKKIRDLFR